MNLSNEMQERLDKFGMENFDKPYFNLRSGEEWSNCLGTALYLHGLARRPYFICSDLIKHGGYKYFKEEKRVGSIGIRPVPTKEGESFHAFIYLNEEKLFHQKGINGPVEYAEGHTWSEYYIKKCIYLYPENAQKIKQSIENYVLDVKYNEHIIEKLMKTKKRLPMSGDMKRMYKLNGGTGSDEEVERKNYRRELAMRLGMSTEVATNLFLLECVDIKSYMN